MWGLTTTGHRRSGSEVGKRHASFNVTRVLVTTDVKADREAAVRGDHALGPLPPMQSFAQLRDAEFTRLDARQEAYLDYTGSGLYFESHVKWHLDLLQAGVFGNPHAESPSSLESTAHGEAARAALLTFLDAPADEYEVVFTANATAAAKLVGESFPFARRSRLVLSEDNHNSIVGIRELARAAGVACAYVPLDSELRLCDARRVLAQRMPAAPSLFAFPAQSNFSGVRHPLELVGVAQELGYSVLLDASAMIATAPLSLRSAPADFVTLSLYKVLGYPTGVGALVVRRQALARLRRPWFAGGTVEFASVQNGAHVLRAGAAGFEDGTPNFLGLSAVTRGLHMLTGVGVARVGTHVQRLTMSLVSGLLAQTHRNGRSQVVVHGPRDSQARGGTVAFNLVDQEGRWLRHEVVSQRAAARGISVRSGCFCNPGAAERAFGFEAGEAAACVAASRRMHPDAAFSIGAFADCMGNRAIGAVRASLGIASNEQDVSRLLDLCAEWRE